MKKLKKGNYVAEVMMYLILSMITGYLLLYSNSNFNLNLQSKAICFVLGILFIKNMLYFIIFFYKTLCDELYKKKNPKKDSE